nr:elongation factor G [bacterium]
MKEYRTNELRNVALLGHGSEGKTTLAEAMLFNSGAIDRMGRVEDGNVVTDFDPEETKRHISISIGLAPVEWKGNKLNLVDVPGYFDFIGESAGAMRVVEGAMILVSAVSGLVVGAEKAWTMCEKNGVARMFVVNQMDRENANFMRVCDQLKQKYGTPIVPLQLPIVEGGAFKGVVDVVANKACMFGAKGAYTLADVPAALEGEVASLREAAMEAAAAGNDELMEKYFENGELDQEDLMTGIKLCGADGSLVPVVCCAAAPNLGVQVLMDMASQILPSPEGRTHEGKVPATEETAVRACSADAPFSLLVFKTVADPFVGKLSLFKVMSGTVSPDSMGYNPAVEKAAKLSGLSIMRGKKLIGVDKLNAGDIGAVAKLQNTMTGHTLCDQANPIVYPPVAFPEPQISLAVSAKVQGEEEKVFGGLGRLTEEDPAFALAKATDTGDMLISGQGELHLEVLCAKLKNKFGVSAVLDDPQIPYRETIRKTVKAEGKHKKQTGGHGQFGHCWIEFSPITDPSEGDFIFEDRVVGGVVPKSFIPAVEKGLRECVTHGVLAGYPMVGIRCALYDGSYHPVDSSEMAFRTAARLAYKKGCAEAGPTLLEPVYRIEVRIPDEYMGDVIGDLNRRRGRIMGMNQVDGGQEVIAEVPLAEVFKYATDLRSMTQARGSFKLFFERYEDVPANVAQKVIEAAKKTADEDDE